MVQDPSSEEQNQRYANACEENDLEKEALQRYQHMRGAYPALADKFIKQLTAALEFKLMPDQNEADGSPEINEILGYLRLSGYVALLIGVVLLAYGVIKKVLLPLLIGAVIMAAYLVVRKSGNGRAGGR